jgi:plasmid maintenance system antidote protein VapI
MSASKPTSPITDVLRRTVVDSGISYKALSRETGVARASIQRFVDCRQSIRLDMADRLAVYFGLSVVSNARPKRPKSQP